MHNEICFWGLFMNSTLVLAFTLASLSLAAAPALVAGSKPLPPKHVKAGLICYDCHQKEEPDHAAIPDDSCMNCHGDYPAMAAYTKNLPVNPHNPPTKDKHPKFVCTDCHHQHKPAEVKCLDCHDKFKLTAR